MLLSIEIFWAQVFVFPMGVYSRLIYILRNFLWSGYSEGRKSLVAWKNLCQSKERGGLGIKEVLAWNKSSMCKYLFELDSGGPISLWHKWIHLYVLKGQDIWNIEVKASTSGW